MELGELSSNSSFAMHQLYDIVVGLLKSLPVTLSIKTVLHKVVDSTEVSVESLV